MDEIEKLLIEEEKEVLEEKPEYEKGWRDTWNEWKNWFLRLWEWKRVPLTILFMAILFVGAVLMYGSIYSFTKNVLVAILSVAFTEAGIVAWEFAHERIKNTVNQLKRSKFMRNIHIGSSVILLITNMAIETATETLKIRIDGAIWMVFGVVGIMSLLDIWNYFYFQDNDKERSDKRNHQKKLNDIANARIEARLTAIEKAEMARNEAEVKYWEENSAKYASVVGRIDAEKRLKDKYSLTNEEVEKYMVDYSNPKPLEQNETEEKGKQRVPYGTGQYAQKKKKVIENVPQPDPQPEEVKPNFSQEGEETESDKDLKEANWNE